MRLLALGTTLVCLSLAIGAGAQVIELDDWGIARVEQSPTSSWYGSTGLILTPSAYVAPATKPTASFHRVELDTYNQDVVNANVSLMADLELGVARIKNVPQRGVLAQALTNQTVFNAKYQLNLGPWLDMVDAPDVAVGVWDAADKLNRAIYVVASKTFSLAEEGSLSQFAVHVGLGDTKRSVGAMDGLFAGVEFVPFAGAVVQVEYDSEDYNAAVRYFATEAISLDVGLIDGDLGWGASARTVF